MLSGTAALDDLAAAAATMSSLHPEPVTFEGTEVFQATFEMSYSGRQATLPPGLHPTTPPLLVVLAWRVADSPWGRFNMAQVRVSCRSGVRPRGFVLGCVADTDRAVAALSGEWGLPCRLGPVELRRGYDRVTLDAGPALTVTGFDPDPLGPADVQFTVTTTLAHTPRGLRLVQVEPQYDLTRAERVQPRLDRFEPAAWGTGVAVPRGAVTAAVGVGSVSLPRLRFVSRPDVMAFEGTEAV